MEDVKIEEMRNMFYGKIPIIRKSKKGWDRKASKYLYQEHTISIINIRAKKLAIYAKYIVISLILENIIIMNGLDLGTGNFK